MLPLLIALSCVTHQEARLEARHEDVSEAMAGHLVEAAQARDALVAGDLDGTRAALLALRRRLPLESLPPQGLPHDARLMGTVDQALTVGSATEVAPLLGQIAQTCGTCHTALGLTLPVDATPVTAEGGTVTAHMRQHQLAAQAMWSALVAGDEAAFDRGAEALLTSTLAPSGTSVDAPVPPLAAELEVRVHDLAGLAVRNAEERGRHFGELLGTCAQCHDLLSQGPATP
jgi:hypothetical protein